MAFSRKGISGQEQSESLLKMTLKPSTASRGIRKPSSFEQSEDQGMNNG